MGYELKQENGKPVDRLNEAIDVLVGTMTSEQWIAIAVLRNEDGYPYSLADKRKLIKSLVVAQRR